ncbi:aminoglycoside phosphotransferase family protein [Paenibacillus illinoisensis]|uniref:aminoglycoside phosphotransferase family protein n=1 Tax=Paenibacillus illinoisensis TaxID=59845 RepID=UPI0030193A3B
MIEITTELVRQLIQRQFPEWKHLTIAPVDKSGHDNRTYRLGNEMTVRLPSHERYASAVQKELTWLPIFKPYLSLPIPAPIAKGEPTADYPLPWSVNQWIEGSTVTAENITDLNTFAEDLAGFLIELEAIDTSQGIPAGIQNFHRGGNLAVYDQDTRSVIDVLPSPYDPKLFLEIWELALATKYEATPLWLHGDVAVGNLLVQDGRLCGVIDFGTMGVGDPSSDLVMAWNFFDGSSRDIFLRRMNADQDMINRARGWALWKALITYAWNEPGSESSNWGKRVMDVIIRDYSSL